MKTDFECLRCGHQMKYIGTEDFQLGKTGFFPIFPGKTLLHLHDFVVSCEKVPNFSK
jgi:hypothetical protein